MIDAETNIEIDIESVYRLMVVTGPSLLLLPVGPTVYCYPATIADDPVVNEY